MTTRQTTGQTTVLGPVFVAVLVAAVAGAAARPARAALPRWLDPSMRDAARLKAAQNPLGFPLRDRVNGDLARLGYSKDDHFELVRAQRDEAGWIHAHLQQTFHGTPVEGGRFVAHQRPDGSFAPDDDAGVRGIATSPVPGITDQAAIQIAERDAAHQQPWLDVPRTELYWLPIQELRLARGGRPVPPPQYPQDVANAMPDPINTDDVVKQLVQVYLAWRVTGVELDPTTGLYVVRAWTVDAHSGVVIQSRDLDDAVLGNGQGFCNVSLPTPQFCLPAVQFETSFDGTCWHMTDDSRKFTTETEDFGSGDPVNCDSDNQWGDGIAFTGDASATTANWQTAMVDGHFGATVYWDLLSNVFGSQGPDDDFYSVNVFMHHGTNYNDANYHPFSGNVVFGDGMNGYNRTRLDCLGHELGHAWNDFNTGFGGSSQNLNESLGDVFGEWTDAYLVSGGFASSAAVVGSNTDTDWYDRCAGRSLISPKVAYWFSNISGIDVHDGSGPASRAFAFLARGASSWMHDRNYSRPIPWGMNGIGLQSAARTYFRGHRDFVVDDDEAGVRKGLVKAAEQLFGMPSTERRAVLNAYAAINVGQPDPTLPVTVPSTAEIEPNDTWNTAQWLGRGMPPPVGAVLPAPNKIKVMGGGNTTDFYRAEMAGKVVTVRLTPLVSISNPIIGSYSLFVFDSNGSIFGISGPSTNPMQVELTYPTAALRDIGVRVLPNSATSTSTYQLDIDLDN